MIHPRFAFALIGALTLTGCGGGGGGGGDARIVMPPSIATLAVPDGTVGVAYDVPLDAKDGRDPISWRATSPAALPPGIAITPADGRTVALAGTPTTAGSYTFTIEAKDASRDVAQRTFAMGVYEALAISTASLSGAEIHDPYTATIQAAGGRAPYAWSLSAGALPPGFTLSASTTASIDVRGTTTAPGTYSFTVSVQDAGGRSAQQQYTLAVNDIERYIFGGKLDAFGVEQVYITERVNGAPATPRVLIDNSLGLGAFFGMVPLATSPDGNYLATIMDREVLGAYDLYVVDVRGPNANRIRRVNNGFGGVTGREVKRLFWSADSRWLAFVGDVATPGVDDLFVADVTVPAAIAPKNVTQYVTGQGLSFWDAVFTSDSRHLVFIGDGNPNPTSNPSGWIHQLYYAFLGGPAPTAIRLSKPLSDPDDMDVETFQVAASGSGIAYRGDLETDGVQDIYHVILTQGVAGATVRVTNAATAKEFVGGPWLSPNGERLVFTSEVSTTLAIDPNFVNMVPAQLPFVVRLDAASPAPVALGGFTDGTVQRPVFSPDGERVLLYRQADDGLGGVALGGELLLVNASTGASVRINATTWDGFSTDVSQEFGGISSYAYEFSPDGDSLFYKQQVVAPGPSFGFGPPPARHDVFRVDLSGPTPAVPVQVSPVVAITRGGADDQVQFSADSTKLSIVFRTNIGGNAIEIYVHDVLTGAVTRAARSTVARLNNNAPGPKWTPGGRGLVVSGPFDAASVAFNEVYFLDLVGGRQTLTPQPVRQDGDICDFYSVN